MSGITSRSDSFRAFCGCLGSCRACFLGRCLASYAFYILCGERSALRVACHDLIVVSKAQHTNVFVFSIGGGHHVSVCICGVLLFCLSHFQLLFLRAIRFAHVRFVWVLGEAYVVMAQVAREFCGSFRVFTYTPGPRMRLVFWFILRS